MTEAKLWKAFSRFIRLRDAAPFTGHVKCITCPNIRHWSGMDCGHGIGRQHQATKYNELNNHAQCKSCNGFEAGNQAEYSREVDRRYGVGTWDKLRIASRATCKRNHVDYAIMFDFYTKEGDKIAKEKNL